MTLIDIFLAKLSGHLQDRCENFTVGLIVIYNRDSPDRLWMIKKRTHR